MPGLIWLQNRKIAKSVLEKTDPPQRGVIGEATTAFEDVARQFLQESRPSRTHHMRSKDKDPLD